MSKYKAYRTSRFKKDYKKAVKRGEDIDKLDQVILLLANGEHLPDSLKDHELTGRLSGLRECHIEPDWLLVYEVKEDKLVLVLTRTGSHSDLFG